MFKRFIGFIRGFRARRHIYFIGDCHFDHANIIPYCHRPFANVKEMNRALVRNWNDTVYGNSTVYYLGDWAFGRGHRPPRYWIRRLKGSIVSIKGSHDRRMLGIHSYKRKTISYHGYRFLLIHNPSERPENWNGWIIHGHKHNNSMRNYPFIKGKKKTINVSVELIGYRPLNIDKLLALNIDSISRMNTLHSRPERW